MRALLVAVVAVAALAIAAGAAAHPLGNFTVNRYSRIEPSGNRVYVLYVLDLAEIPTFQAREELAAAGEARYATRLARRIARATDLAVAGARVALTPVRRVLAFPPGQAGLRTTRLEVVLRSAALPERKRLALSYRDRSFGNRIGWKEIVVQAGAGARVLRASAPSSSVSEELLSYPRNLLQSPLDVTRASATIETGSGAGTPPALPSRHALEQRARVRAVSDGGFASLIARDHLSVGFVLVSILIAIFWGAAHALSPGHGKSIVAAYLVGARGTPRHAVVLGLTVTVTHTIGVFALGLVTLSLSELVVPDRLYPWLNLVSALLVVAVGLGVLRWRLREWRARRRGQGSADHHHHHHHHYHRHDRDERGPGHARPAGERAHGHAHCHEPALRLRSLLGVGISSGIIPCPTALVVLLAAISLHRIGYGLVLILAFSLGLAGAMTAIGLLAVSARRLLRRVDLESGVVRLLPAASALVVLGLGLVMTARAVPGLP